METPQLYTVREVAGILRISTRTVQRMIQRGDIKAVKIGGTTRIRKDVLDAILEQE